MCSGAVGNIIINAHGERICLLEYHADLLAQPGGVYSRVLDVLASILDLSLNADAGNQIIHAVKGL